MSRLRIFMAFALATGVFVLSWADAHATGVVQVVTPGAVALPLYGAAYSPQQQTSPEVAELLKELVLELRALREQLAAQQAGGLPAGAAPLKGPVPKVDALAVLKNKCASCHTSPSDKGGGFDLYTPAGQPVKLNPPDKREVTKRVANGSMPPPSSGRLTPDEKDALLRYAK